MDVPAGSRSGPTRECGQEGFHHSLHGNTSTSECSLRQTEEEGEGELWGMCTPKSSVAGLYTVSVRLTSKE